MTKISFINLKRENWNCVKKREKNREKKWKFACRESLTEKVSSVFDTKTSNKKIIIYENCNLHKKFLRLLFLPCANLSCGVKFFFPLNSVCPNEIESEEKVVNARAIESRKKSDLKLLRLDSERRVKLWVFFLWLRGEWKSFLQNENPTKVLRRKLQKDSVKASEKLFLPASSCIGRFFSKPQWIIFGFRSSFVFLLVLFTFEWKQFWSRRLFIRDFSRTSRAESSDKAESKRFFFCSFYSLVHLFIATRTEQLHKVRLSFSLFSAIFVFLGTTSVVWCARSLTSNAPMPEFEWWRDEKKMKLNHLARLLLTQHSIVIREEYLFNSRAQSLTKCFFLPASTFLRMKFQ